MAGDPAGSGAERDRRALERRRRIAGWALSAAGALLLVVAAADATLVQARTNRVLRSGSVVEPVKDAAARTEMTRSELDRVCIVLGALAMVTEYATRNRRLRPVRAPQAGAPAAGTGPDLDAAAKRLWGQAGTGTGWSLVRLDDLAPQPQQTARAPQALWARLPRRTPRPSEIQAQAAAAPPSLPSAAWMAKRWQVGSESDRQ